MFGLSKYRVRPYQNIILPSYLFGKFKSHYRMRTKWIIIYSRAMASEPPPKVDL